MRMNNRKRGKFQNGHGGLSVRDGLILALGVLCLALIIAVIILISLLNRESGTEDHLAAATTEASMESVWETTNAIPETTLAPVVEIETTEPEETETTEETQKNQNDDKPKETQPKNNNQGTKPKETEPVKTVLSLPYAIPGSNLVVQRVASYDGIYMEDGSNQETSGVAMMLLKNTGAAAVEYAEITMRYDDKTLTFKVSALPAGSQVIVQAEGKAGCARGDLTACSANVATLSALGMAADQVSVVDNGDNTLTVTNLTDSELATVRVFYKYYMAEEATFVGGITYTAKISNLGAGASVTISPSHFTSASGKIVMVRTYDTDA